MNTQPEALQLADCLVNIWLTNDLHERAAAELRRLHRVELAYNEWITKTEWVQETAQPKELGKHRADILTKRIEVLHEVNQMLVEALESLIDANQSEGAAPGGFSIKGPTREHQQRVFDAWQKIGQALAKAKEQT